MQSGQGAAICCIERRIITNVSEPGHEKRYIRGTCEQLGSRSASEVTQPDNGLCYASIYFTESNNSLSGQRRPRSDCAHAQSDLGLRCPFTLQKNIFTQRGSILKVSGIKGPVFQMYSFCLIMKINTFPVIISSNVHISVHVLVHVKNVPYTCTPEDSCRYNTKPSAHSFSPTRFRKFQILCRGILNKDPDRKHISGLDGWAADVLTTKYSITSMARTRMARLPWMIRTLFSVPTNFLQ